MWLATCTIVVALCVTAEAAQGLQVLPRRHFIDGEQLGVHFSAIIGKPQGVDTPGSMHIFVKGVINDSTLLMRGFIYYDEVEGPNLYYGRLHGTDDWLKTAPRISILVNGTKRDYSGVEAFAQDEPTRPAVLKAYISLNVLPKGNFNSTLAFHFDGIPNRRFPLTPVVKSAQPFEDLSGPPKVYTFVSHNGFEPQLGARMVKLHCEWHKKMGFHGTLLYITPNFLDAMVEHPHVQHLVNSEYLTVVRWDYFPDLLSHSARYTQAAAGNHALLSLWGRNAWLLLTDLDELFSTRVPSSVGDMLREPDGCLLHGRRQHEWWHGPPEQVHLDLVDVYCQLCKTDRDGELEYLLDDASLYVLRHWTIRDKEPTRESTGWKSLVDPNSNLYKYAVHEGFAAVMHRPVAQADNESCAYVSHMRNAVATRNTSFADFDLGVTDWLWPVAHHRKRSAHTSP